jgi:hypothetical protein
MTPENTRWIARDGSQYRKCRECVRIAKTVAKAYVKAQRSMTLCDDCGRQPVEYHRKEHEQYPARRIHFRVAQGHSIHAIAAEISRCVPLCRRCHMKRDGRSEWLKRPKTPEWRAKLSTAVKALWANPEYRAAMLAARRKAS